MVFLTKGLQVNQSQNKKPALLTCFKIPHLLLQATEVFCTKAIITEDSFSTEIPSVGI